MTRIIGLLSWFDEPVETLVACLTGLWGAGVDHVVAVDGAYALFPDARAVSPVNQYAAIVLACRDLHMGLTLHAPPEPWEGNEVQKRTFLFALALTVADHDSWFWVMDADQVVMRVPDDLKDRLAATEHDTAEVEFLDVVALRANQPDWPARFVVRDLFRAQPITVRTNHATYVSGDGRVLWGYESHDKPLSPALDLSAEILVEHRPDRRSQDRQLAKLCYYAERDRTFAERGACDGCGERAVKLCPTNWRVTEIGPVADWTEACADCAVRIERKNAARLRYLGIDPASVVVENRNGRAPARIASDALSVP